MAIDSQNADLKNVLSVCLIKVLIKQLGIVVHTYITTDIIFRQFMNHLKRQVCFIMKICLAKPVYTHKTKDYTKLCILPSRNVNSLNNQQIF